MLLIVPYGIETIRKLFIYKKSLNLLIVPYGIETYKGITRIDFAYDF